MTHVSEEEASLRWGWVAAKGRRLSVMTHNGRGGPAMAHHLDLMYVGPSWRPSLISGQGARGDFLVEEGLGHLTSTLTEGKEGYQLVGNMIRLSLKLE